MTVHHVVTRRWRAAAVRPRDHDACPVLADVAPRVGLDLRLIDDLGGWAAEHPTSLVLLGMVDADDWAMLHSLARVDAAVVALLGSANGVLYRRALGAGACAVAPLAAGRAHLAEVLQHAVRGNTLIPRAILRELRLADAASSLSEADVALLDQLAAGKDTKELAAVNEVSERTMYRRLDRLYSRLQVTGRSEATQVARSLGLIAPATTPLAVSCQCRGVASPLPKSPHTKGVPVDSPASPRE